VQNQSATNLPDDDHSDQGHTPGRHPLLEHMAGRYRTCTPQQLAAIDAEAMSQFRISLAHLIERAGDALADETMAIVPSMQRPTEVHILAGKGHNGADGLAAAWLLRKRGMTVTVYLLANESMLDGPSRQHLEQAISSGAVVHVPAQQAMDASGSPARDPYEQLFTHLHTSLARAAIESGPESRGIIVIDAMLGTAVSRPLEGVIYQAVMRLNAARNARLTPAHLHVLAADVPTGLDAQAGLIGACVHADSTLSFVSCKPCFGLSDVREVTGPIRLASLDLPQEVIERGMARAERR
jgi:hydroxyethylthiazole kinase-like uncharacterized protein yjeF